MNGALLLLCLLYGTTCLYNYELYSNGKMMASSICTSHVATPGSGCVKLGTRLYSSSILAYSKPTLCTERLCGGFALYS